MREFEKEARIKRALELLGKGLDTEAVSQRLGIDTRRLHAMLRRYGYTPHGIRAEVNSGAN